MKVIYFKRIDAKNHLGKISTAAAVVTECIYIPEEKVILFKEHYGKTEYSYIDRTNRREIFNEISPLLEGKSPNVEGVIYSDIKKFEESKSELIELIDNARLKKQFEAEIKSGIEKIIKFVECLK